MPGAGGLVTANRVYNGSERDGSVLTKLERAVPQLAIQGNRNANFDPVKFTWLGSLSSYANDAYLMLVNASHPAKTAADLTKPGISVTWFRREPDRRRRSAQADRAIRRDPEAGDRSLQRAHRRAEMTEDQETRST
jgi:hypothetical protein